MKVECYLIVQGVAPQLGLDRATRREAGAIRVTKKKPSTRQNEIAVKLDVTIPDSLFIKPVLQASITVPDDQVFTGIDATVAGNISKIIKEQTGFSVDVTGTEPPADETAGGEE